MSEIENDEYWVERYLAGEATAFDQLVRRTQSSLFSSIFRIVGSRDEALDVLQETYLKIYRNLHNFKRGSTFHTWAYRIAVNQSISHKRKRRLPGLRLSGMSRGDDAQEIDPQDPHSSQTSLERLMRQERNSLVESALQSLPATHRAVLVMCDYDDLKYEEIAEILEIPIGTVRSRIHRAREELRKRLGPMFNEDNSDSDEPGAALGTNSQAHKRSTR